MVPLSCQRGARELYVPARLERVRRTRLAESLNQGPRRDFWMEMKKMSKANRQTVNKLDGMCSDEDIAEHLSNKYRQLFSSAPTNQEDYDILFDNLKDSRLVTYYFTFIKSMFQNTKVVFGCFLPKICVFKILPLKPSLAEMAIKTLSSILR